MSLTINTNYNSLNAQRNLVASQMSLSTSMQRLSSGLRVNSAKDDAAGLAIASRMEGQSRGLTVAARNANDGISMAQTAEGALGKVSDMLQRMRELAVQASNASNSQSDRDALNAEVTSLKNEIGRLASQTSFNGTKLIDGTFAGQQFQVGANAQETITVGSIADVTLAKLGSTDNIRSFTVDSASTVLTSYDTAINPGELTLTKADGTVVDLVPANTTIAAAASATERAGQIVSAINAQSSQTGVLASYDATNDKLSLMSTSADITLASPGAAIAGFDSQTIAADSTTHIEDLNVTSFLNAQKAMAQIDNALSEVNSARAGMGALQSRFEDVVSNIQVMNENVSAARGRIVDADFAAETANMSRSNILQQAGTAMLAQANQLPQQVLQLLR